MYKHIIILTIIIKKISNGYIETTVVDKIQGTRNNNNLKKIVVGKVKFSTTYVIVVLKIRNRNDCNI